MTDRVKTMIELPALEVSPQAMVSELRREMKARSRVYPRLISAKKLSQSDADHRTRTLDQILAVVEAVFVDELRPPQLNMLAGG